MNIQETDSGDDDVPTSKFVAAPDRIEVIVIERHERLLWGDRAPLLEVSLMVTLESESNFYVGFTDNLSDGGVFVATHAPKPIGSTVSLIIALPQQMPVSAQGRVAWLREYSESNDAVPGMGIQFDLLLPRDADRILEFARTRDPIFFDGEIVVAERVASP